MSRILKPQDSFGIYDEKLRDYFFCQCMIL